MILVTGATGFIGVALVERLLRDGLPVRVLHQPRSHEIPLPEEQVEPVRGSIFDEESLHQAMTGVHTVIHLASAQWWGRRRQLEDIDVKGTRNVISAGRSARIGRLIVLSHLGSSPSSAFALLRAKGQVEEQVRASGLAYTVFRSGVVFGPGDSFVNGIALLLRANPVIFYQPGHGEGLLHPLYVNDLVEALVRSLEHLDTVDQVIGIGGPEYMTFNEMVRTVMRVTQAKRAIVSVPPYALRFTSRLLGQVFPYWPMTPQWLDMLASNRVASMSTLYDLFGMQTARFEDTILTYMRGRRYTPELLRAIVRRRPHAS